MNPPKKPLYFVPALSPQGVRYRFVPWLLAPLRGCHKPLAIVVGLLCLVTALLSPVQVAEPPRGALFGHAGGIGEAAGSVLGTAQGTLTQTAVVLADLDDETREVLLQKIRQGTSLTPNSPSHQDSSRGWIEPLVVRTVHACPPQQPLDPRHMRAELTESPATLEEQPEEIAITTLERSTPDVRRFRGSPSPASLPHICYHSVAAAMEVAPQYVFIFILPGNLP